MTDFGDRHDPTWWAGQRAVVTGAASGIGLAMAGAFAERGSDVVLADIDGAAVERAAAQLRAEGLSAKGVQLDVSESAQWEELAAELWRDRPVTLLCNNAGIVQGDYHSPHQAGLPDAPTELWERMIAVNLNGVFHGVRAVVGRMVADGLQGHVVNTASMAGFIAPANLGIYAASKFGVVGLSESLRAEMRRFGIGVSVLAPGGVATSLTARPGEADAPVLMEPASVAERVVRAIEEDHFYVFPHPEYADLVRERVEAVLRDLEQPSAQDGYRDPERTLVRSRNPEYAAGS